MGSISWNAENIEVKPEGVTFEPEKGVHLSQALQCALRTAMESGTYVDMEFNGTMLRISPEDGHSTPLQEMADRYYAARHRTKGT